MIYQIGAPVLRQLALPVLDPHDVTIQAIADEMLAIVAREGGMGIAAPQLGYLWQMMVISSHPNQRYPFAPLMSPLVLINPQILSYSAAMITDWEGCLSVPDQRGQVSRHQWVTVQYDDRQGKRHTQTFRDFIARIFQHEFDHLQGKLFIDRVDASNLVSEATYRELIGASC
jgi:peptide deformylase